MHLRANNFQCLPKILIKCLSSSFPRYVRLRRVIIPSGAQTHACYVFGELTQSRIILYSWMRISHLCSSLYVRAYIARVENVENWKKNPHPPNNASFFTRAYPKNLRKWPNAMHWRYSTICISHDGLFGLLRPEQTRTNFVSKYPRPANSSSNGITHIGSMGNANECICSYTTPIKAFSAGWKTTDRPTELLVSSIMRSPTSFISKHITCLSIYIYLFGNPYPFSRMNYENMDTSWNNKSRHTAHEETSNGTTARFQW